MEEAFDHVVYSKNVVEFVTVAKEYCSFAESAVQYSRKDFLSIAGRILPLLYLKAVVLPKVESVLDDPIEKTVDEMMYAQVKEGVEVKMGRFNDYLEVFSQDMKYSETPVIAYVAEDLADIYQDVKDFISAYRIGVTEIMNDALSELVNNFELYWGQRLVNTLRALHAVQYSGEDLEEEEGEQNQETSRSKDNWFISRLQKDWQDENEDF